MSGAIIRLFMTRTQQFEEQMASARQSPSIANMEASKSRKYGSQRK
jgi:hypothetical protein